MKLAQLFFLVVAAFLTFTCPLWAQAPAQDHGNTYLISGSAIGAGLGAAITILGAGYGFGRIGASALESMARQPEVAGRVQTAMLIIAALLEGATFFSLIICFMINNRTGF
jgi:F-type H+-transporting ATPase subunit c